MDIEAIVPPRVGVVERAERAAHCSRPAFLHTGSSRPTQTSRFRRTRKPMTPAATTLECPSMSQTAGSASPSGF